MQTRRTFLVASTVGAVAFAASGSTVLLSGCSTTWITTVLNDIPELINIANSVLAIVALATGNATLSTSEGAIITTAAKVLAASLSTMQDAANAYNASKSQGDLNALIAATQAVQKDLGSIVAALPPGTVSSDLQIALVGAIGLAISIMSALVAIIPGAAPVSVTAASVAAVSGGKVNVPTPETIRYAVDCTMRLHGFATAIVK